LSKNGGSDVKRSIPIIKAGLKIQRAGFGEYKRSLKQAQVVENPLKKRSSGLSPLKHKKVPEETGGGDR